MYRPLAALVFSSSCLLSQVLCANGLPASLDHAAGAAIGSAGFDEMLAKNIQSGVLTTEQQSDGSFLLNNPVQAIQAQVTSSGTAFASTSKEPGKSGGFALSLTQWGREGSMRAAGSSSIYRDGDAVFHTYTDGIAEKFSNTGSGIRQDFIVPVKPVGNGALQINLSVDGATVSTKNDGFTVAINNSQRKLTYDRLKVTDANSKAVPAHMHLLDGNIINIVVDDGAAQYPLTIDPTVGDENWVSMGQIPGVGPTGSTVTVILSHGSDLYLGGTFSQAGGVEANYIARWNGSKWSDVGTGTGAGINGSVSALAMDSAGNLYAGGTFTGIGGVSASYIAKWNGSVWAALGSGVNNYINSIVVDSSDNLYVGGSFSSAGGVSSSCVAKWDGSSWSAMPGLYCDIVYTLEVDDQDSIYAGGFIQVLSSMECYNCVAKWDGYGWSSLGNGGGIDTGHIRKIIFDGNGYLYAAGDYFSSMDGVSANRLAKWNGSTWSGVGSGMDGPVYSLAVDANNNVYVGGSFNKAGGLAVRRVAMWNGVTWSAIGSGFFSTVNSLVIDATGRLYAGGEYFGEPSIQGWDGSSWVMVGGGIDNTVNALVCDDSGGIYVGGSFSSAGGIAASYVAKWNGVGWEGLGSGVNGTVYALAFDGNGNLYAGGAFTAAGGVVNTKYIAKWDGSSWSALDTGFGGSFPLVSALAFDGDGNLYAGGQFTNAGGVAAKYIAKWNGATWSALGAGVNGTVSSLAIDDSDNVYVGGGFTAADGVSVNRIAQWNGSVWLALGSGMNGGVRALTLDRNNNLYAGGDFTVANGVTAKYIAKWNGADWSAIGGGTNGSVNSLKTGADGGIYVGGGFASAGGLSVNRIAKWDGATWSSLGTGMNSSVSTLVFDSSNNLYAGGNFTVAGGKVSAYLAKWTGDADTDHDGIGNFSDNCVSVSNADQLNTDGDGEGNACDSDDDNDGVPDISDAFPLDASESVDVDGDAVGNNADNCPLVFNALQTNTDGVADGGDACDTDDDNDGAADASDAFPLDASESMDTDSDGTGNNADDDDDNDGIADASDAFPLDASESVDTDGDGIGDNTDNCLDVANPDQLNMDGDIQGDACDVFPNDPTLLLQQDGTAKNEKLGNSVAMADMNNDGVVDLLIGSPMANVSRNGTVLKKVGKIQIISGKDNSLLRTINGSAVNEQLGAAMAVVPDQNKDGMPDIIVGNPLADVTTLTPTSFSMLKDAGRVMLYSGGDGRMLLILAEGKQAGDHFGAAVAVADVNADNKVDLIVGASMADAVAKDAGQVTVFNGLSKAVLYARNGEQAGEHFGAAVTAANNHLFVGSPQFDAATIKDAGRVSIFNNNEGNSAALLTVEGAAKSDSFGASLTAANDNWAVGIPLADSAGKDAGSVQVFSGLNATPITVLNGATAGDNFGNAVNMQGDVNKDGKNDIAIGAAKFDVSVSVNSKTVLLKDAGRVEVLSGKSLE